MLYYFLVKGYGFMEQTITAKIQIVVNEKQSVLLQRTLQAYQDGCNEVSEYIFKTHDLQQSSLNKHLYQHLRQNFGLKAQMAQSVIKTVVSKYKTILENEKTWIQPVFKHLQYDLVWNRDYSLTNNQFSVNTLEGRVKLPYHEKGMERYFNKDIYKFGTAKLVVKHQKYFLHIPVTYTVDECTNDLVSNVVGVDRGVNFVVTAYGSDRKTWFVNGRSVKQTRARYKEVRRQLQRRQTPSARRRLKEIGTRENRWMQDVNHCISKALVERYPKHTLFVLEDLTGIRQATEKVIRKHRYEIVSWSFYDLEQKIRYKAERYGSKVINVNPAYTSQTCPCCGHTERANRRKKIHTFVCKRCGYRTNDDRIGAMNLYRMGINYLVDSQVPDTVV